MNIKYIVHTHGHIDHCGATRALVEMTGAKTFIGEPDRDYVNGKLELSWARELGLYLETFEPDVLLHDGDEISLGNSTIKAIATPGHTPGAMSYLFNVDCDDRTLTAGLHGGAGLNTLQREFLERYGLSDSCRTDYIHSMERLKKLTVDVFLGNHAGQSGTHSKYQQLLAGYADAFIDPTGWGDFAESCKQSVLALIKREALIDKQL